MESTRQYLLEKVRFYLLKQKTVQPVLFFAIFLFAQNFSTVYSSMSCYLLALLLTIFCQFNVLFILPTFLYANNLVLAGVMFLASAISCNQKWKAYLFMFCIADSYFPLSDASSRFIALNSIFMSIAIHKNLIFQTIRFNVLYFVGFFTMGMVQSANSFAYLLNIEASILSLISIGAGSVLLGYSIIMAKLQSLRNQQMGTIKDSRQMAHYLGLLKDGLKVEYIKNAKLSIHERQCNKMQCFCKNQQFANRGDSFIRQILQDSIRLFPGSNDPLLYEQYIDFLMLNDQIAKAIYFLTCWSGSNYFSYIALVRCEAKIINFLRRENSSNTYEKEYIYALQYDQHCLHLITEIHQILKLKIKFWKEVGNEAPLLRKLQEIGCSIVDKMYNLNIFYSQTVKTYEQKIYSFDSTVLYAMYLISTTNFKNYAKSIIKNTSKLMEEVNINENHSSETFSIRTIVKNCSTSYIKEKISNFKTEQSGELSFNGEVIQNNFKLIIDRVSSGFCRLIRMEKQQLIGTELSSIIPDGYKEVHNIRLSYLLDFNNESIHTMVPSKIFHRSLKLPIKGLKNELYTGFICIKFHVDIEMGLSFVSIIKRISDRTCSALVDFNGKITEKQHGFQADILKHVEVKKYLQRVMEAWTNQNIIKEETFNIIADSTNYNVTIGSPLLGLFLQKKNLKATNPPIHIDITNEQTNKNFNFQLANNNKVGKQLKKMQKMLMSYDHESSTTSTKGVSSAVNVISSFSENNTVAVYKHIIIVFMIIVLICLALNISVFLYCNLDWNNSTSNQNPIQDIIKLYEISLVNLLSSTNILDATNYVTYQKVLNLTRINSYQPYIDYNTYIANTFTNLQVFEKIRVEALLSSDPNQMGSFVSGILNQYITVTNYGYSVIANPSSFSSTQSLAYRQALMLYVVDLNLMQTKRNFSQIIQTAINPQVTAAINYTIIGVLQAGVDQSLNKSMTSHIIFVSVCAFGIFLMIIPMYLALRKRYEAHEKIYDLLASVDSEQTIKQIRSLLYISNILNNYNESRSILKTNVLDYQENVLMPKIQTTRRASADNQLVMGLQKYDINQPNIEESSMLTDRAKLLLEGDSNPNEKISASLFTMIKAQLFNSKKVESELKKRKRSGELDISGSEFDPQQRITGKYCILYIIIFLFAGLVLTGISFNIVYIQSVLTARSTITALEQDVIWINKALVRVKTYLWGGSSAYIKRYHPTSVLSDITTYAETDVNYDAFSGNESVVVPSCGNIQKLCEYNNSFRVFEAQMQSLLIELYEMRMMIELNSSIPNAQVNIYNVFEKAFYVQSLANSLSSTLDDVGNAMFTTLINNSLNYDSLKQYILIFGIFYSLISLSVGLSKIYKMKKQYFKEVYMLTFLNDNMIMKNKRVESYLESLSKNTYL